MFCWKFNGPTIILNKQYIPLCKISCFLRLLNIRLWKCNVRWTLTPLHLLVAVYIGSAHVSYFANICCKQNFNRFQCIDLQLTRMLSKEIPKPVSIFFLLTKNKPVNLTLYNQIIICHNNNNNNKPYINIVNVIIILLVSFCYYYYCCWHIMDNNFYGHLTTTILWNYRYFKTKLVKVVETQTN